MSQKYLLNLLNKPVQTMKRDRKTNKQTNKQLSSSHRSVLRTLGDNTRSKYITQQHEYLMFDGRKKRSVATNCAQYRLKTKTAKNNNKTLICSRILSVIELNEICVETTVMAVVHPDVLLVTTYSL